MTSFLPSWLDEYFSQVRVKWGSTLFPRRGTLEIAGSGVSVTDDPTNDKIVVSVSGVPYLAAVNGLAQPASAYTLIKTGSNATLTDAADGSVFLNATQRVGTEDVIIAAKAKPATDFTCTIACRVFFEPPAGGAGIGQYSFGGLAIWNSALNTTQNIETMRLYSTGAGLIALQRQDGTSLVSLGSSRLEFGAYPLLQSPGLVWLRVVVKQSGLTASKRIGWWISYDGTTWHEIQFDTGTNAEAIAVTHVGVMVSAFNNPAAIKFWHFDMTTP